MSTSFEPSLPSDIRLLLRADAEQCWLHREVIPVLQEVEAPEELPEEEVGAALAYLEAMWNEATLRAQQTDAAHRLMCSRERECEADAPSGHAGQREQEREALSGLASRYHAAVRALRRIVAERVTPFVDASLGFVERQSETDGGVRVQDKRSDGCTSSAA